MILWILITLFLIITGTVIIIPSSEEEPEEEPEELPILPVVVPEPTITSFGTSTGAITGSGTVTLTGDFTNDTNGTAVITAPGQSATTITSGIGTPFTISQTTTFTLTVTNNDGVEKTQTVTVTVTPLSVAPSITYTGPTGQNAGISAFNGGTQTFTFRSYNLSFRLTFPAGTTRVRLTNIPIPYYPDTAQGGLITNVPDFVPTATQTSADVVINKSATDWLDDYRYELMLMLNDNTTPSATYFIYDWME